MKFNFFFWWRLHYYLLVTMVYFLLGLNISWQYSISIHFILSPGDVINFPFKSTWKTFHSTPWGVSYCIFLSYNIHLSSIWRYRNVVTTSNITALTRERERISQSQFLFPSCLEQLMADWLAKAAWKDKLGLRYELFLPSVQ